jgi:hypothetical protein
VNCNGAFKMLGCPILRVPLAPTRCCSVGRNNSAPAAPPKIATGPWTRHLDSEIGWVRFVVLIA